ncbi:CaiB/BaiF CoA transferase family protein [Fulvivirga lutimaris]|uniref:CaiB/BaiF CoA transferase family protein n=1 Tax=Fulvivirga lutimaris TaxID=1819566 RepID=UPI0012BCA3E1|nr:CaiB/BaiF CoA-transferase family protein [Fulvivirga lutimaris]MTI41879.1 CoA transferase [Fulvivirga lutimaris]
MSQLNQLFKDLMVLELASVLAGPSVGQFFAELGAEVVKVENPTTKGDVTRSWRIQGENKVDNSAYFSCINWGKKSIAIDISKPEGLNILYSLVEKADIVITSYKPGDDVKFGVDYKSLKLHNSKIIYGQITGYGSDVDKVGYDAIIQAEAGFMMINGEPDSEPLKMPVALIDILAGHQLKEAILLSYIKMLQTGEGSKVEVSLIDAGIASLANQASNFLKVGNEPKKQGSAHPNIAPYGETYVTADDRRIMLAVGNNKQFKALCEVLNLPSNPQYSENSGRVENRKSLNSLLTTEIGKYNAQELIDLLNIRKVPVGLVNGVSDAIDAYAKDLGLFKGGKLEGIRTYVEKGSKPSHIPPPPKYGEHTTEILENTLGISAADIAKMAKNGILDL